VLDLRVDDEQAHTLGGQVEGDLLLREVPGVEEQGVAGLAARRRRLVHDADRGADVDVLGALAQAGQLPAPLPQFVQVVQGERHGDLQRRRRRQARARRHRRGQVDVGAGDGVAGRAQRPDHARRVRRPVAVRLGYQVVDAQLDDVALDVRGVQAQYAVGTP
jgi:hypothetical protein